MKKARLKTVKSDAQGKHRGRVQSVLITKKGMTVRFSLPGIASELDLQMSAKAGKAIQQMCSAVMSYGARAAGTWVKNLLSGLVATEAEGQKQEDEEGDDDAESIRP